MLADLGVPIDRRLTDSAVSGLDRRKEGQSTSDLLSIQRRQHFRKLLKTDLRPYRTDPEKLYRFVTELQTLALEIDQRPEGKSMHEEADPTLAQSRSNASSRIPTDDSQLTQKGPFEGGDGIGVVFSPSDNRLTIRQLRSIRSMIYPPSLILDIITDFTSGRLYESRPPKFRLVPLVVRYSLHLLRETIRHHICIRSSTSQGLKKVPGPFERECQSELLSHY
jgi:hypothetical protein